MIPAEIATKLAKIIPRLATEHDGEVVATVRAISRTLAAANLDWHAVAAAVEASAESGLDFDWTDITERWAGAATSKTPKPDPHAPEAPSRRWGLPIWGVKKIELWNVVAGHCLQLDWYVPKAFGGRFLSKDERARLKDFERIKITVTNADADWIEDVVTRCHAARDRWRGSDRKAAA